MGIVGREGEGRIKVDRVEGKEIENQTYGICVSGAHNMNTCLFFFGKIRDTSKHLS